MRWRDPFKKPSRESLPAQLLKQEAVFRFEIFDYVLLVPIDPTSEDQH